MSRLIVLLLATFFVSDVFSENELTSAKFANSINQFSCDFLKQLNYADENVVYSPVSVAMALGMVLKGAKGETAEQIYKTLHINEYSNKEAVHTYLTDLIRDQKLIHNPNDVNFRNITIELANLILTSKSFNVQESFTKEMKDEYYASVGSEDFVADGPEIMKKVNKFVSERTHNLIPKLLEQQLGKDTIMFLLNTIYFKAYWEKMFYTESTHKATFYNADKTNSTVQMMSERYSAFRVNVNHEKKITLLELDYLGNASMIFVSPHETYGLKDIVNSLTCQDIDGELESAKVTSIPIRVPKFKFDFEADVKAVLQKMGLTSLFTAPDLSGIAPNIKVSDSKHKALISINEGGTEAAGVTTTRYVPLSGYVGSEFIGDHPFLFFIRDKKSGLNLFAGVVNKL